MSFTHVPEAISEANMRIFRRSSFFVAACLACCLYPSSGVTAAGEVTSQAISREQAQAILDKARKAYELTAEGGKPFHLAACYRSLHRSTEVSTATLVLDWQGPAKWRRAATIGESTKVRVRDNDRMAVSEKGPWNAEQAYFAQSADSALLVPSSMAVAEDDKVQAFRHERPGETDVIDVVISPAKASSGNSRALRFDAESGALLRQDLAGGSHVIYENRMSDGKLLFTAIKAFSEEKQVSQWSLTEFRWLEGGDQSLYAFPEGAKIWTPCSNEKETPKVARQAQVEYPEKARMRGLAGKVVIAIQIGADGKVLDAYVTQSSSVLFEESAVKAVKEFRFAVPACLAPGAPIDWMLTINFQPTK